MKLTEISTKKLSKEFEKREGVITIYVESYEKVEIGGTVVDGPAVIFIDKNQVV